MRKAIALVGGQARTLLFVAGFAWCYAGLAGFSLPLARAVAGVALMAIAVWPYVRRRKESA